MRATTKFLGVILITAVLGIFAACKDDEPEPQQPQAITRDFTITVGGKTVAVKDTRTGANETSLEDLGILTKLTNGFTGVQSHDNFNEVMGRTGLVIEIEDTTTYTRYKAYSATKLGFNFASLNEETLPASIAVAALVAMKDGATYPSQF